MKKTDVQFHGDYNGYNPMPVVNVKVHSAPFDPAFTAFRELANQVADEDGAGDGERFLAWLEDKASRQYGGYDDIDPDGELFNFACEIGWERLQEDAETIFEDYSVKVYSRGRSGGYAYIEGLPDFEYWDAIMLGKWARFCKWARETADDVPYQMLSLLYCNDYERFVEQDDARQAELVSLHSQERGAA